MFADAEIRLKSLPGSLQDSQGNDIFLLRQSIGPQITNENLLSAHTAHDDNGLKMDPLAPLYECIYLRPSDRNWHRISHCTSIWLQYHTMAIFDKR